MRYSWLVMSRLALSSIAIVSLTFFSVAPLGGCGGGGEKNVAKPKQSKKTAKNLVKEGKRAEKKKKFERAEKRYTKALRLEPDNREANVRLIKMLTKQERHDEAAEAAKTYVSVDEKNAAAYHLLADTQLAAENLGGGEETLTTLIDRDPSDPTAFAKRGNTRAKMDNLAGAAEDFETSLELEEGDVEVMVSLGEIYQRQKKNDKAKEILVKALESEEEHPRGNRVLGTVYRSGSAGDLDLALSHHLKAVRFDEDNGAAHFELGITQNLRGDNVASEEALSQATKLSPEIAVNWYAYGESLRIQKRGEEAIPAYEKALKIDPTYTKAASKLGFILMSVGKVDEAETVLTEAVRQSPDEAEPYFNLGYVYEAGKKYSLSVNSFTRFSELAPKDDKNQKAAKKKIRQLSRKIRR